MMGPLRQSRKADIQTAFKTTIENFRKYLECISQASLVNEAFLPGKTKNKGKEKKLVRQNSSLVHVKDLSEIEVILEINKLWPTFKVV